MSDVLAKHVARQMASKRLDAFWTGAHAKPVHRAAEAMSDTLTKRLEVLPTLRKMFFDCVEVGAFVPVAEVPAEKREMLAGHIAELVRIGLLTDGENWTLTKRGHAALTAPDDAALAAAVFPDRPTREQLQARLDAALDRAAEIQAKLGEVEAYVTLCRGRNQSPW